MQADNERFGATAAGRADLKGSAGMPPLTSAGDSVVENVTVLLNRIQPDSVQETVTVPSESTI